MHAYKCVCLSIYVHYSISICLFIYILSLNMSIFSLIDAHMYLFISIYFT